MQIKIFTIPILGGELLTKEMNVFLRSKFTDHELTELSKEELLTPETFKKVKGIGEKKMEKYAHYFLSKPPNEKSE